MIGVRARKAAAERKLLVDRTGSPGEKYALRGRQSAGYFGEVPASDFVTAATLSSSVGVSGTANATGTGWLKFCYKGKILFVTKQNPYRGVSWNAIYSAGAAYPVSSGNGVVPGRGALEASPTAQSATHEKDDIEYDVRLLTGAEEDPSTTNGEPSGPFKPTIGGEWVDLIYNVSAAEVNDKEWESFSDQDMSMGGNYDANGMSTSNGDRFGWGGNGNASWVQESAGVYSWPAISGHCRMLRGFGQNLPAIAAIDLSTSNINLYDGGPEGPPGSPNGPVTRQYYSWRPVLEVYKINEETPDLQVSGRGEWDY